MSRTEVLSTCTMQLPKGDFCDAPADERWPNRICTSHAIKVYLAVQDQIPPGIDLAAAATALATE